MKKLRPEVSKKLKSYSAFATALIAAGSADGQIVYQDVDPDVEFNSTADFFLMDMDADGNTDFVLYMATNTNPGVFMGVIPYGSVGSIAGSTGYSGAYLYPTVIAAGEEINNGISWNPYDGSFQTMASVSYYFAGSYGNWFDISDGYLGLRINTGSDFIYGWARLDAAADGFSFTLKDFAYNSNIGEFICAGDFTGANDCLNALEASTWVSVSDESDNSNGTDLGFSFNGAANEDATSSYRVIAVKSVATASFDLAAAEALSVDQYTEIAPAGTATYTGIFAATSQDSDGDLIVNNVGYQLFVLSSATGASGLSNVLSSASNEITLTIEIAIENIGQNIPINVFPNPAENILNIEASQIALSQLKIKISDITGKAISDLTFQNNGTIQLDISTLQAGIYTLHITDGNNNYVSSFTKQ